MAKAVKQPASGTETPDAEKIVLTIDIGGSHVKILTSAGGGGGAPRPGGGGGGAPPPRGGGGPPPPPG
ncbi:hypothetical protein AB0V68_18410, partial [Mesorhizobium ciceri]